MFTIRRRGAESRSIDERCRKRFDLETDVAVGVAGVRHGDGFTDNVGFVEEHPGRRPRRIDDGVGHTVTDDLEETDLLAGQSDLLGDRDRLTTQIDDRDDHYAPLIVRSRMTKLTPAARIGSQSMSPPTSTMSCSIRCSVEAIVNSRTGPPS